MRANRIPRDVWLATFIVGALRAIPFAWTRLVAPAPGTQWLPVGYVAKDTLQYVALVREPVGLAFANPFTTEAHSPRIISLFLSALSWVHHATGLDPFWALEIARVPLLFLFFLAVWGLAGEVLGGAAERRWALWIVALSGGLEAIALPATSPLRPEVRDAVAFSLNHAYGWSTFAAAYNPLWLAALIPLVSVLRRALRPGQATARDAAAIGAGIALVYATHPYSAVAGVVVVVSATGITAWLASRAEATALARKAIGVLPGCAAILAIVAWQLRDPAFRATAGGLVGPQQASPFFYPIALGAVGLFAVLGAQRWVRESNPWRFAIGGWVLGIGLLHSSPVLNGYHFVSYLHVPASLLAASGVAAFLDHAASLQARRVRLAIAIVGLFTAPVWLTGKALEDVRTFWVNDAEARVLSRLAELPPGNVLGAPGVLGKAIPAYAQDRVFAGHWFLTPDYDGRLKFLGNAMAAPFSHADELRRVVADHRIAYVVAPIQAAPAVASVISATAVEPLGAFALLRR